MEYLVHLCHNCIQNLAFKRPKNNCFVLDRVDNKSLARLYDSSTNVVYCCHGYDEPIPAEHTKHPYHFVSENIDVRYLLPRASSFDFREQFLFHCFHKLRSEVPRV